MPFSRSKSVEFLFHQLPFKFLWYTGKVLLARLVHLCSGFTKSTIFCDGLAQTTKFTKLTIFRRTKSGAADLTTDSPLLCKIKTHDPQSGTVDLTILTEIAKLKNFTFFSRFCHNCSPNVMEIKTHPPSVAGGMHSSIAEVRRVNFDCKKRNIKSKKPCDFEYCKWPNKRPGRLFNFGGPSGEV